ncbi:MAG: hypothetical protein ACLGHN_03085 [Bacteriovoracia bacterium]
MNITITSFIILVLSTAAFGQSNLVKETTTQGITEKIFDINKDGKGDLVEVVKNKQVIEIKEDIDFDGNFDRKTSFYHDPSDEYFKIIEESAGKNRPRRISSYWKDKKDKKTYSLVQVDQNNDGKWDTQYKRASDTFQKREECNQADSLLSTINDLADSALDAVSLSDDYVLTKWGHQIHKSCLEGDDGGWFLLQTERAISEGLSCLDGLSKNGGRGAGRNLTLLNSLLSRKNVQIICNEPGYDWGEGTVAHATSSGKDDKAFLKHPGISMNPRILTDYKSNGPNGITEFKKTIFHEQLHNLGYLHNHDIEYPYACETCCFPENENSAVTEAACKVCSGNYAGNTDIAYIRDITSFGALRYNSSHAVSATLAHIKENPDSIEGMGYLALNLSGIFDPVGGQLAEKVMLDAKNLTSEQRALLDKAKKYNDSELFKNYQSSSKIVADAYYEAYKSGDPLNALKQVSAQLDTLKTQFNRTSMSQANEQYVRDGVRDHLKKLIYDIWLYDYSGKITDAKTKEELGTLAYTVFKELYP